MLCSSSTLFSKFRAQYDPLKFNVLTDRLSHCSVPGLKQIAKDPTWGTASVDIPHVVPTFLERLSGNTNHTFNLMDLSGKSAIAFDKWVVKGCSQDGLPFILNKSTTFSPLQRSFSCSKILAAR